MNAAIPTPFRSFVPTVPWSRASASRASLRSSAFIGGFKASVGKPEVDLGSPPRDDIRKRPPRPASHGPAQRAVAGVEVQVRIARGTDERDVGGRGGTQPGPEGGVVVVGGAGEDLARAPRERLAAHGIQLRRVARELRR